MSTAGKVFSSVNRAANLVMVPLVRSPKLHHLVSRRMAIVTYTGRRSGHTFSTPVAYARQGDEVVIGVALADQKSWWRNFEGDGGDVTLRLRGIDHGGHAVASRDDKGRVQVKVRLRDG